MTVMDISVQISITLESISTSLSSRRRYNVELFGKLSVHYSFKLFLELFNLVVGICREIVI
jgi:hypothetical protein